MKTTTTEKSNTMRPTIAMTTTERPVLTMYPTASTLEELIYSGERHHGQRKDILNTLSSVLYSFGSENIKAYTYHGAEIAYVWDGVTSGGIVVNLTMGEYTMMTSLGSVDVPEGWKSISIASLQECGALPAPSYQ